MSNFTYKTKGNLSPDGKQKIYFCCHPKDFDLYFETVTNEVLLNHNNCAVWFLSDQNEHRDDDFFACIKNMQMMVIPVTRNLLTEDNNVLKIDLPFAIENKIPILPLMQESGLEKIFNEKFGALQFLDKTNMDPTAIQYKEKLETFLTSVLANDVLIDKIRNEFKASIFLSYRKADRRYAHELMRIVHSCEGCTDIAFWYDEYLAIGEDFNDSIANALQKSDLFALVVTPTILMDVVDQAGSNKKNYVEEYEFPMAKNAGKFILPIEFFDTNKEDLINKYGIIDIIPSNEKTLIEQRIQQALLQLHIQEREHTPEHDFFIGLAYLNGIGVEPNGEKALEMIKSSANRGWIDAVEKLIIIYSVGLGTERNEQEAIKWLKKKLELLESQPYNTCSTTTKIDLAKTYFSLGEKYAESIIKEENEKAIKLYQQAFSILQEIVSLSVEQNLKQECLILLNKISRMIAVWYESQDDFESALSTYKRVLNSYEKTAAKNTDDLLTLQNLVLIYEDLGVCYIKLGKIDLAKDMFTKALKVCEPLINVTDGFKYLYVSICNHIAKIFINEEKYDVAYTLNKKACVISEKLYEHAPSVYCFKYSDSLFIKALIIQQSTLCDQKELKTIYQKIIDTFESNSINMSNEHWFNHMVALYKLANIYSREEDFYNASLIYDKCLKLIDVVHNFASSEEVLLQVANIYLDCGILWYGRDDGDRDLNRALKLFNIALEIYTHLSEKSRKYIDLLKETREKINVINQLIQKYGESLDGKEINVAVSTHVCSTTMKEYTEKGELFENQEKWLKALEYYIIALKKLDKLEELTCSKYRLARADLCERIGSIQVKYNNYETANIFYMQAYEAADEEVKQSGSQKALTMLSLILDKMGSIAESPSEKFEFYSFMFEINKALLENDESEERLDSFAYSAYKLALCDELHPDKKVLKFACKIWKDLYETTNNLEYKKWYLDAKRFL